jgi:hypothetical protein
MLLTQFYYSFHKKKKVAGIGTGGDIRPYQGGVT